MKTLLTKSSKKWVGFTAICWALTPLAFRLADLERGYDATGGEALIPLLPIISGLLLFAARKSR